MRGRWTPEERNRFLEALQKFGKDWEKIDEHVATRRIESIRSYAQKLQNRLARYLAGNISIKGMTIEDAALYHAVLSQRLHKAMKLKKPDPFEDVYLPFDPESEAFLLRHKPVEEVFQLERVRDRPRRKFVDAVRTTAQPVINKKVIVVTDRYSHL